MTVKELRTLVDNLDEYIHVPDGIDRLKKTILHLAVSGQLVPQDPSEGTGEKLYQQIQAEKTQLIKEGKLKKQKPLPEITEDEIPFEIPESWKWVRLANVSSVITDGDHQAPPKAHQGIPFLVIGDVRNGKLEPSTAPRRVPLTYFQQLDWAHKPLSGDLLYTTVGSYGIAVPVAKDEAFCFQRHIGLVRPAMLEMQKYFYYFLNSNFAFKQATKYATGIAQKTVPVSGIRNFFMPLPPLAEQKRLIKKIYELHELIDDLTEKYRAEQVERQKLVVASLAQVSRGEDILALKHLDEIIRTKADAAELRKTILHLAVSGQLVPQDPSEGTGEKLYQQIQAEKTQLIKEGKLKKQKPLPEITEDEIPFEIPESWKWVRLGDLVWLDNGVKSSGQKLNYLEAKYLRGKAEPQPKTSGIIVDRGQRIILVDGENSGEVFISPEQGYLGSTFKILGQVTGLNQEYIDLILKNLKQEMRENKVGSAIPHLDKKLFREKPIGLPSLPEQIRIIQKTARLLTLVDELEAKLLS